MPESAAPTETAVPVETYSYLGPAGTFTEAALAQVPQAVGQTWHPVNNVGQALDDVVAGRSVAAMIAIENTVEGGVSASQDALATIPNLRIIGEYLVNVNFVLVAKPGHDAGRRQSHQRASGRLRPEPPLAGCEPAASTSTSPSSSNVAAAASLLDTSRTGGAGLADAAIAPPTITNHHDLDGARREHRRQPVGADPLRAGQPKHAASRADRIRQDQHHRRAARQHGRTPARDARAVRDARRQHEPARVAARSATSSGGTASSSTSTATSATSASPTPCSASSGSARR